MLVYKLIGDHLGFSVSDFKTVKVYATEYAGNLIKNERKKIKKRNYSFGRIFTFLKTEIRNPKYLTNTSFRLKKLDR